MNRRHFISAKNISDPVALAKEAIALKKDPFAFETLGKRKTLCMIFLNASLRTRLSTQKAARNLGMDVVVMNMSSDGWQLETAEGVVMDGGKAEHVKEAAAVIGQYCDVLAIRSFPGLVNKEADYAEEMITSMVEYSGVPVVNMESGTRHPLQSLADIITIEEHKKIDKPKVVLTWAPHIKPLPQAVSNSFAEWINKTDYDFVITHPKGYELDSEFVGNTPIEYDQEKAFAGADFIYTKNWSAVSNYGKVLEGDFSSWTIDGQKMGLTNNGKFMHCLPVRRNVIVADEVLNGDQSIVIPQAGNREFSAQIVLKKILEQL